MDSSGPGVERPVEVVQWVYLQTRYSPRGAALWEFPIESLG